MSRRSVIAAALGVGVLSGCGGERKPVRATKKVKGDKRTDAAPLVERFPALGTPVRVAWFSGTVAGSGFGPSTYWIDAVVQVTPQVASGLSALGAGQQATPRVVDALAPDVPEGSFVSSPELDAAFHSDGWRVSAFLQPSSHTLVLSALGQ